ncbi:endolytic transglycosylase MltG [Gloeobacter violaceus]|uniref:Endolytic murein transglycosylase n=1 Tax=Gloeobacter violaceus (strain ATCC 29082 / PCC 7421) TaxID=251221 RepID=Q7NLJ3_GLOVI|nr:endolytic transglycosylase MltG [Gloeobacter violaceus]BAC89071.1 gll1130 [Gloeobacter violaceus PCC 7421]
MRGRGTWWRVLPVLVVLALGAGGLWVNSPPPTAKAVRVVLPTGSGSLRIGQNLADAGAIRSAWAWLALVWVRGWQNDLKAGTYEIPPGRSLIAVADQVRRGETLRFRYRIIEGWNLAQMASYFEQLGYFRTREFLALTSGPGMIRPAWLPEGLDRLEGFLFPSTYELPAETLGARAAVNQMLSTFEKTALPLWRARVKPARSLKDWVALASLIEKEAAVGEERATIAGVFANRLRLGMPLASDPTVEYAFGIRQTADTPLTYAQVLKPSPYNTYINPGLPPTPIASPGLASLEAALAPALTPYLYFVARYDGTHVFSRTEAEHEQAKRQIRAERRAGAGAAPQAR